MLPRIRPVRAMDGLRPLLYRVRFLFRHVRQLFLHPQGLRRTRFASFAPALRPGSTEFFR